MTMKKFIFSWANWYVSISTLCIGITTASMKYPVSDPPDGFFDKLARTFQKYAFLLLVILVVTSIIAQILKWLVGNPNLLEALEGLAEEYRAYIFDGKYAKDEDRYKHKVTIFEHRKCVYDPVAWLKRWWKSGSFRGPWSGLVVPVARSGHANKSTDVIFSAHEDETKAEGVAGLTFSQGVIITRLNLPDINANHGVKSDYVTQSLSPEWLVEKRLRDKKELPLALIGIPIFSSSGAKWGVMVIDSIHEDGIKAPDRYLIKMWQKSVQMLLKSHDL
jgi:hypothetical protein